MIRHLSALRHTRPHRPEPGTPAGVSPAQAPHGGPTWLRPVRFGRARARRGGVLGRVWLLVAALGLLPALAAQAGLSGSPNPSTGSYTVSWTAIAGATKYQLLEDGAISYEGTSLSTSYTGKAAGSYVYTLTYCQPIGFPVPTTVCNLPSNFEAVTVTVSGGTTTPPPAAPTLTVPATDDDGSYAVSWTSPADAEEFELEEKVDNGGWTGVYSGADTLKSFTGKGTGVYAYRVKACDDSDNCSGWSSTGSVRVTRTSSSLTATPNPAPGGDYTVSWGASALSSTYQLNESVDGGAATQVYSGTGLSKSFAGRNPGSYAYGLKVCFSLLGSTVCVPSGSVTVTVPEPEPSGNISASPSPCTIPAGQSRCTTTVTWSTEDADGPCIFLQGSGARFACGASGSKDAPWIGTAGATFLLKNGNTFSSDTLASVTVSGERLPPAVPTLTVPADDTDGAYSVSWTSPTGANRYHLDQKAGTGDFIANYRGTGTSKAYTGKRDGTYGYRVRACIGASPCSEWSPTGSVRVLLAPGVPGAIQAPSTDTHGAYTVSWGASTGTVDDYVLERRRGAGSWAGIHEGSARRVSESGLGDGTYNYRVKACNDLSCSAWTAVKPVEVLLTPGVPGAIAGPATSTGDYTLNWAAATGTVSRYELQEYDGTGTWPDPHGNTTVQDTNARSKAFASRSNGTYRYRVRACNRLSCSAFTAEKTVAVGDDADGVPDDPAAPDVEADGSTELDVDWEAPSDNGSAITDYDIRYREKGATGWSDHAFAGTGTSATIAGLTPHTTYRVQVLAHNSVGPSGWSPSGEGATQDVVPDRPAAPAVTAADSTSLDVSWSAPTSRGSDITDYDIRYREKGTTGWSGHAFAGTGTSATIAGLTADTAYQVQVLARNDRGESRWSPSGEGTTPRQGVPETPAAPDVEADGSTELDVDWEAPSDNGSAITDYDIRYNKDGATGWSDHAFAGTGTSATIAGLTPHTTYRVQVLAHNSVGPSGWSPSGEGATQDVVPDRPAAPAVTAADSTSLDVSWSAPTSRGSDITDYDIRYREKGTTGWSGHAFAGTGTSATIAGLTADTAYQVQVLARNDRGESHWSPSGEGRTGTITTTNTAPSAVDDTVITPTDTAIVIDVLANDSDADDDALSIDSVDDPPNGSATVNSDGTVTYTPDTGYTGSDSFDYTVTDGADDAEATVTVFVSATASTLSADPNPSATGNYTVSWTVSSTGSSYVLDESTDGGMTWTRVYAGTALEHALTGKSDGTYHYKLSACFTAPIGGTICVPAAGPYAVTVKIVPPPGVPGAIRGPSESNGWHTLSWGAATGSPTRYELQERRGRGGWAAVPAADGLNVEIAARRSGEYGYRVRACNLDACGDFTAIKTVAVFPDLLARPNPSGDGAYEVYWTPTTQASSYQLIEDGTTVHDGTAPAHRITGKPPGDYHYTVDFCLTVGSTEVCNLHLFNTSLTVTVLAAPVAADDAATTLPNVAVTVDVLANDTHPNGNTLSIDSVDDPDNGAASIAGGRVVYTPDTGFTGTETFDYTVTDNTHTDTATVTVIVNTPPTAADDSAETTANTAVSIDVLANDSDADGDTLTIAAVTDPANGTAGINGNGTIAYTPDTDYEGIDTFVYTVTDGVATATATVTVRPPPTGSISASPGICTVASGMSTCTSTIDWSTSHAATACVFVSGSQARFACALSGSKDAPWITQTGATFFLKDGNTFDSRTLDDVFVRANRAPTAADDTATTTVNTTVPIDVLANDSDADGDTLAIDAVNDPINGTASIVSGEIAYTPDTDYVGTDTFDYTVTDDNATGTATVTVTVNAAQENTPPAAADDTATTPPNTAVDIDVLANDSDADGDALSIDADRLDGPHHGSASVVSVMVDGGTVEQIRYTPAPDHVGTDTFVYAVSDRTDTDTATVTVTVNTRPTATDDAATTAFGAPVTIDVLANDSDADGHRLTVTSVTTPTNGTAGINSDGDIDYGPNAGFLGTDRFNYAIQDIYRAERQAAVSVRVHPAAPGSPGIEPLGPDHYAVSWDAVAGTGAAYELEEVLTGGTGPTVHNVTETAKTFTARPHGTYTYRVRACAANANCGEWSASVPVTVPLPPPPPDNLTASTPNANGDYTVSWNAVAWGGATLTYTLEERTAQGNWRQVHNATATTKPFTAKPPGAYHYRVKACTASTNCSNWTASSNVTVGMGGGPNTPPATVLAQRPQDDPMSDKVGATGGSFQVNEAGAATYRIPILTAPGVGGMAPQIALVYNSQGGNGLVGQGFSIGGMSGITRCRQTQETDGSNDGIGLDAGDRFCLDGQRLVLVNGTYGAADSEYRTEIDTYVKVVARGGTAGNPAYFEVWRKDGTYSTYGNTADSALEAPGSTPNKILYWARDSLEDSAGNAINYVYHEDTTTGEHRIASIAYAGGDADIEFNYEARDDDRSWYVAGFKFQSTKRLYRIVSRNNSAELRTYNLTYAYGAHNDVSQLTGVEECNGTTCYPATTFAWSNPAIALSGGTAFTHQHGFLGGRPADIDGDGVNELVWEGFDDHNSQARYYLRLFHYNGTTFADKDPRPQTEIDADGSVRGVRLRSQARNSWTVIDYNNDGRHDVLYMRDDKWRLRLGKAGPSLSEEIELRDAPAQDEHAVIADVNSDGLPDAIRRTGNVQWSVRLLKEDPTPDAADRPYHFEETEIALPGLGVAPLSDVASVAIDESVFDFNADGVADFFVQESHFCEIDCGPVTPTTFEYAALYASIDGDYLYRRAWSVRKTQFAGPKKGRAHFPDLNGDGYADIAYAQPGNVVVFALSDGKTFGTLRRLGQLSLQSEEADQIQFLDYNGDGRPDLVYPDGGFWRVLEFHDDNFAAISVSTGVRSHEVGDDLDEWRTTFFDGTGDGKADAIRGDVADHSGPNTAQVYLGNAAFQAANVVEAITDGFGAATTVTYKALTDSSATDFYSRASDANGLAWGSPVFDLIAPVSVVQSVSTSAPAAGTAPGSVASGAISSVSYEYTGAKVQAGGRGWLGFESITSIDGQTGLETRTVYEQRFPYTGRPKSTELRTSAGDLVSQSVNTWADFNAAGPNRQPYLERSVEKTYSTATSNAATGAFTASGTVLSTVTTDFTMNGVTVDGATVGYGDVDTITVTTTGDGQTYARVTDNDYLAPDLTQWHLGRLSAVTVTHKRDDNAAANVMRKSSFTYDATTGLLKTETVQPGGVSGQTLITTYTRDSAGNVTEVKDSGYGGPAAGGGTAPSSEDRRTTTVYDSDKRYVTVKRNHYGHAVETVVARNSYGTPTAIDDVDGHRTEISYGAMGRESWRRDQVGGYTHRVHRLCSETGIGCPTGAKFRVRTETAGGGETIAYYDLLGREVRSSARMFDGRWSIVLTEYDALGRPVHVSAPFASSGAHTGTASHWTRRVYDHLGRLTRTTHPDGSTDTVAYDGYTATFTDGLAKTRKEQKNALGELVRIEDHDGGFVTFGYDEQGNLEKSTQGGSGVSDVVTTMGYDLVGRKTSMTDPDRGAWRYTYNAFGELVEQTTATGDCTRIGYDHLGRQVRRIDYRRNATAGANAECGDSDFTETADSGWEYDHAASNGLGKLRREYTDVGTATPFERTHAYDAYGRPVTATTEIVRGTATDTYAERTAYDQHGRVFQAFDGAEANSGLEYAYNAYGYLLSAKEARNSSATTHTYYTVTGMDARGNVTGLTKAGLAVSRTFDAQTGLPDRFTAKTADMSTVHDLDFAFDVVGNLTARRDRSRRVTVPMGGATHKDRAETYCYDGLHRLTSVHGAATTCAAGADRTLALTYDALGNITTKRAYKAGMNGTRVADANADVGTYTYSAGSRAVTRAGSTAYAYDANGSMISGGGRSIAHTVFNKPSTITKSAAGEDDREVLIHYGPNRDRYRRIDRVRRSGATVSEQTTHYAGPVERIWRPNGTVETKRYLDGELIVTRTEASGTVTETEWYLFKDHLGSTDLITDRTGAIEGAMSFDAFGLRRSADSLVSLPEADRSGFDTSVTTRGFTGHEGLDAVGLVHMNGRVYDPLLGRFISADPYIPAPNLTQSYNPYSYAMNNPTSYVDPDGFFFKKLLRVVGTIASIVWAIKGNWIPLIINSVVNAAIELVPELGRVAQAFNYATVASSSLPGRSSHSPSKMCIAANCLNATTEVEATVAETASEQYARAANGAYSRAYIMAFSGGSQVENKSPDTRAEESWFTTLGHILYNQQLRHENIEANCEIIHGPGGCAGREAQRVVAVGEDLASMTGAAGAGSVLVKVGTLFRSLVSRATAAVRLGHAATARSIANGHAFSKHAAEFGFSTRAEMAAHIERVMRYPTASRNLVRGRTAYWHEPSRTLVIRDPSRVDKGTVFKPESGRAYFDGLKFTGN